jgi:hypothetical protein
MRNTKKIQIIMTIAALASMVFLYSKTTSAQESINITFYPTSQTVNIKPGETKRVAVAFVNNEFYPILGNLKAADFIVREDNIPKLIEDTNLSTRYSAASWIHLPFTQATLPVKDRLIVYADVTAPKDALPGGHYASIYFETSPNTENNPAAKSGEAVVTHQFGALLSFRVAGDVKEQAKIFDFSTNTFQEHGPFQVSTKILNEGYIDLTPVGTVALYNAFGAKVAEQKMATTNIFPEAISKYENNFGSKWMFGRYKVMLTATYGDTNKPLSAQTYIWIMPWKELSVVILAIIIIALLIKNLMKKSRMRDVHLESQLEEDRSEIEKLKAELRNKD